MEISGDEISDGYSDVELDEATLERLDRDPNDYDKPLPLNAFEFGSEDYGKNFKKLLSVESKRRTGYTPFAWQLEVALNCHLGRDGFLLAGTGSGKTLAMIALAFLDKRHRVFMISPLNALANGQVKQFEDWGITAVAVNATTRYKDLYKDIKNGKYQIIISSIEAFLDPTRLLPIVKSPELAALGPQIVIVDEAHCIVKWGPHFRPQYANMGSLKLLLTGESPFIAATATANRLSQEAIKQTLRFGPDSFEINLGNRRWNIAYSVHRITNVTTVANDILDYFPSRSHLDGFTLIFVDSRKIGNQILYKLRQYLDSDLRGAVQLYHATRSEYDKEIMAAGFERADGFRILICTEALTMGVDFRKVTLVIQVLAPTDTETLVQRMGRCGRNPSDPTALGQAVVMVQDSVFEDSKAAQKRLLKNIKKEDAPGAAKPNPEQVAREIAKDKARRVPKEIHQSVVDFVNTTGCRMEVLDKVFDNPPAPEGHVCSCDNCLRQRGEITFRERMLANRESAVEGSTEAEGAADELETLDTDDEATGVPKPKAKATTSQRYRPVAQRAAYVDALNAWVDRKYNSDECAYWDITKDWIMTDKQIKSVSMHPGMSKKEDLKTIKPNWVHYCRWGAEVFEVVDRVNKQLQEDKARDVETKRLAAEVRRVEEARKQEFRKRKAEEELEQARRSVETAQEGAQPGPSNSGPVAKRSRAALKADATPEERAAHKQQQAERKKANDRARYQRKKAEKLLKQEEVDQHDALASAGNTRPPSPLPLEPTGTTSEFTLKTKQEEVDNFLLLNDTAPTAQTTPASQLRIQHYHVPAPMPPTPSSSSSTPMRATLPTYGSSNARSEGPSTTYTWVAENGTLSTWSPNHHPPNPERVEDQK